MHRSSHDFAPTGKGPVGGIILEESVDKLLEPLNLIRYRFLKLRIVDDLVEVIDAVQHEILVIDAVHREVDLQLLDGGVDFVQYGLLFGLSLPLQVVFEFILLIEMLVETRVEVVASQIGVFGLQHPPVVLRLHTPLRAYLLVVDEGGGGVLAAHVHEQHRLGLVLELPRPVVAVAVAHGHRHVLSDEHRVAQIASQQRGLQTANVGRRVVAGDLEGTNTSSTYGDAQPFVLLKLLRECRHHVIHVIRTFLTQIANVL